MDIRFYHTGSQKSSISINGTTITLNGGPVWDYGLSLTWYIDIVIVGS